MEKGLLREFKRAYQQYSTHMPTDQSTLEWLSLMRHHGAPTRLRDFSYSIYVAAYFALEDAEGRCAICWRSSAWRRAMNPFRLNERLRLQKGIFLIPGDITLSFEDNLQVEALEHLYLMNITRTSLFPGLDGETEQRGRALGRQVITSFTIAFSSTRSFGGGGAAGTVEQETAISVTTKRNSMTRIPRKRWGGIGGYLDAVRLPGSRPAGCRGRARTRA